MKTPQQAYQTNNIKIQNKSKSKQLPLSEKNIMCAKATRQIIRWLEEHQIICYQIYFDEVKLSPITNVFILKARAIDEFNNTAHIFEITNINYKYNLTYVASSMNKCDLMPGDISVPLNGPGNIKS